MLHLGIRARIVGGTLREGDEGEPRLAAKTELIAIAADRMGSNRVFNAYRHAQPSPVRTVQT